MWLDPYTGIDHALVVACGLTQIQVEMLQCFQKNPRQSK